MELLPVLHHALRQYLVVRGVRSRFAAIDGARIHYYDRPGRSSGPPVVLVHGLGGSANGFYKLIAPLAARFGRVVALDLPGNGFSPLEGNEGFGSRRQLGFLTRFLEEVVGEPAFVIGNSLGGAMAVALAHEHPEQVRALGLVAPAGAQVGAERHEALIRSLQLTSVEEARALTRRLFHRPPATAVFFAGSVLRMYGTPAVKAILAESGDTPFLEPEMLQSLEIPTLLVWGESERLLPFESIDFFRAHLPAQAEVHVVKGFGHVPQVECPAELARLVCGFADRAGL